MRAAVVVLLLVLAGCSDDPAPTPDERPEGFEDADLGVDDEHGVILGVVVDDAIVPVAGAAVRLMTGDGSAVTDQEGRFAIGGVLAGSHLLNVSKLNFESVQVSVTVVAGVESPELVKVQLPRLFSGSPFMLQEQFNGFITCGYDVNFASSLCLNDYTRFIPIVGDDGGIAPQLQQTGLDDRDHDYAIENGWQTHIVEMTWEPSADSTSEQMNGIISHFPRPATHWYAAGGGEAPVLIRMEQGVEHDDRQDEPTMVPPEGLDNMHFFAAANTADGDPAAVAIDQSFEVFFTTFYHGKPPEGWSFIGGDGNPF